MKVRELRAILDHLPADAEVAISGAGVCHVRQVAYRRPARNPSARRVILRGYDLSADRPMELVAAVEAAPPFTLRGPFHRPAALARLLDPDVPAGRPA